MPSGFRKIHPQDQEAPKAEPKKGRGAVGNPTGRYESVTRVGFDDGWDQVADADWTPPPLRTTVTEDKSRSVICRHDSPDVGFGPSINPYRGCEHGCIYCFARPSHAYFGLSTGLDFESKLFAKNDADKILRQELANPRYVCDDSIAMGTNTDPYQPLERERQITRRILRVLSDCHHPVSIVTKSALVLRDIDILAPMAKRGLAIVLVSVSTLDRNLARRMEPRAATPEKRLAAIRGLNDAGVPAGVMVAPIIPGLTDHEIEPIMEKAAEAKAQTAGFTVVRLPYEIKDLFREWLHTHVPLRASHVETLIREVRGGKLNDPNFGSRMRGSGPYAEMIAKRFRLARERFGIPHGPALDTSQFERPPKDSAQLSLL